LDVARYATVVMELAEQKMMLMRHRFNEFLNASHRFDKTKSWALFKDYKVPEEWGGMHPKWVRVFCKALLCRTSDWPESAAVKKVKAYRLDPAQSRSYR
jgi:hypothetical protein